MPTANTTTETHHAFRGWLNTYRRDLIILALLWIVMILLFAPMTQVQFEQSNHGDYNAQIKDAQTLLDTGSTTKPRPNFLFMLETIGVHILLPGIPLQSAAIILITLYHIATATLIYVLIRARLPRQTNNISLIFAALFALTLLIVMPIFFFTADSPDRIYFAFMPASPYHNPTTTMLRPLAIGSIVLAMLAFQRQSKVGQILLVALFSTFAILTKPSFHFAFIPALGLFALYRLMRRKKLDIPLLIVGFLLPTLLVVGWQYLYLQDTRFATTGGGIALDPLGFVMHFVTNISVQRILFNYVLSIAFPLYVYAIYNVKARRNTLLNLSWLAFLIGSSYAYFLIEAGKIEEGNFFWSGIITVFVLFVMSTLYFIEQNQNRLQQPKQLDWRFYGGLSLYSLHVIGGVIWFQINISGVF